MSDGHPDRVRHVEITRERRVRRLGVLGAPLIGVALLAVAAAGWSLDSRAAVLMGVLLFLLASSGMVAALIAPLVAAWIARARLRGPLALVRDREELALVGADGRARWTLPWSQLGVAWACSPRLVEIATASGDELRLFFDSPDAAAAAVRTLRRRGRERRAYPLALESDSRRLLRQSLAWLAPCAVGAFVLASGPEAWPAAPIALALAWLGARGTRRLVLGADGVVVERRFSRRYVPYRDIARIESRTTLIGARSLALRLTDGRRVALGTIGEQRAALVQALLEEGLRMVERGEAAGASAAALAMEPGAGGWREALRGATSKIGYRGAALDVERLLSIARNPAAEAAQRVAAALALRAEPAGLARIRVAADVSAEPEVKRALEVLSADALDERAVERALRAVARR